ncbi:MAG: uL15 family ribosomal protein [Nanoarchaeota archaeon]|nr:uL15 family ribosomal protein [Nanoarchaeota archaeon]MBU1501145.1 uL15 family ribosomal protein [Nanoarchaeota archaeon]MBU2458825.1 uL15 family ribosomal protein [Nanoarchaeota archaeon]
MPLTKTKKKKKSVNMRGKGMGGQGWGARKKHKKSGHRGGSGMAGTGKRADQKKTLITKLYGHGYFGKQGITSKKVEKDKGKRINLSEIETNIEKYGKKVGEKWNVGLKSYKILAGEVGLKDYKVKNKLVITAMAASKSAIEKVKKAGGEIIVMRNAGNGKSIKEKS